MSLKSIETKTQKVRREKRKTLAGIIIAAVLVLSTIGFTLMQGYESREKETYNGYDFIKQDNLWQTEAKGEVVATLFLPQEVEDVTTKTPYISRQDFSDKVVYFIAKNDLERQASFELSKHLPALRMQFACLPGDEDELCSDLPEKTCENLTGNSQLVIIQDTTETTNSTEIEYTNGCLEIEGNQETMMKAIEKIIFIMFGIIG
jgi:hypothetical protein